MEKHWYYKYKNVIIFFIIIYYNNLNVTRLKADICSLHTHISGKPVLFHIKNMFLKTFLVLANYILVPRKFELS